MFQMPPDIPGDADDDETDDHSVETLHDGAQARVVLPLLAQLVADIGEREAPRPRADEGINLEFDLRHAGDARWQRDKRAHHRQQPADENRDAAVAREKIVDPVEFAPTD